MIDSVLRAAGLHPKKFRLLLKLFRTLSDRQELLNQQLGFNDRALTVAAALTALLGVIVAAVMLVAKTPSNDYLAGFLFFTAFLLGSILMSETAHTLVNPEEGLVLAHQPIDGATYTAAKLAHLGRVVFYMVGAMNAAPALLGWATPGAGTFYPLRHMGAALAIGMGIALTCCALFGWLMRYVPPARMKAAAQVASGLAYAVLMMPQLRALSHLQALWKRLPAAGPWVTAIVAVVFAATVVLGLRALSADYLIRVTRLVQGGARKRSVGSRNRGLLALPGKAVSLWLGGPAARAGFAYLLRMVARDWQFRRQIIGTLPTCLLILATLQSFGSPFGTGFSAVHTLPHIFGLIAYTACSVLEAGAHPKAVWVFEMSAAGVFARFARGAYAGLWSILVLAPHAIVVPAMVWLWPAVDVAAFLAYSVAVATLYLSLSLGLVDGLPFGRQAGASRSAWILPVLIVGGIVAAAAVGIQYYYLFRSHLAASLAAAAVGAAAVWFGRRSVSNLSIAIRHHLNTLASGKQLYQEVG